MFGCIPENTQENILQCYSKNRAEGVGVRRAFLKNDLQKIGHYFLFDHHFTIKQTHANLKIFFEIFLTGKQTKQTELKYFK